MNEAIASFCFSLSLSLTTKTCLCCMCLTHLWTFRFLFDKWVNDSYKATIGHTMLCIYTQRREAARILYTMSKMFDCCSWTAPNINGLHTAFPLIIFFKRTHSLKDFDYAYICIYIYLWETGLKEKIQCCCCWCPESPWTKRVYWEWMYSQWLNGIHTLNYSS
jgi:hypothetical protein